MDNLKKILVNLPEFMVAFFTISITLVVFCEFLVRETFNVSIFGFTGELTRILIVWLSMLGAAVGVKRGSHFVFPIIAQRLGPEARSSLAILSHLTIIGFAVILIISGLKVTLFSAKENFISIPISVMWENLAVPVSGFLIMPYCLLNIIEQVRSSKKGDAVGFQRSQH